MAGITLVTWQRGLGFRQMLNIGVLAVLGSALSYGVRPLFLKYGLDAAVERARAYADAGADLVFVEAPTTLEERRRLVGLPALEALAQRYAPETMEAIRDA